MLQLFSDILLGENKRQVQVKSSSNNFKTSNAGTMNRQMRAVSSGQFHPGS